MELTLSIIGWLMIVATVLPFVRSEFWLVRVFDFPRLQITIVFAVVFALYLIVREDPGRADNLLLAAMTLSFVYQLWRMWPYTPLHHKQVQSAVGEDSERGFSVLISNVLMTNRNSDKLRALIREHDPDVVLVVETDAWWQEELRELERSHPNTLSHPRENTYGMLLYSRLPLIEPEIRFLVEEDVPSIRTGLLLRSGERVQLYGVHPRPPAPGESTRSTERDAELLIVAKELKGRDVPCIVLGDLNDVAWSRTNNLFQKISSLLDPRIGRGFFSTFNANWPFIRFPLDHAFVSHHFGLSAFRVLSHAGSDHFPVFVRLTLMPAAREANHPPEPATKSERQEANDKIARAG